MRWVWRVRRKRTLPAPMYFAAVDPAGGDGVLDVAAVQDEADCPGRMIVQGAIVVVAQEMVQVEIRQPADDACDRAVDARGCWLRPCRAGASADSPRRQEPAAQVGAIRIVGADDEVGHALADDVEDQAVVEAVGKAWEVQHARRVKGERKSPRTRLRLVGIAQLLGEFQSVRVEDDALGELRGLEVHQAVALEAVDRARGERLDQLVAAGARAIAAGDVGAAGTHQRVRRRAQCFEQCGALESAGCVAWKVASDPRRKKSPPSPAGNRGEVVSGIGGAVPGEHVAGLRQRERRALRRRAVLAS
jgi:hypothetical protein